MTQERRSTTLAPDDWERLDRSAALTQSLAESGTNFGNPTWRAWLRRVVRNEKIMSFIEVELTQPNNGVNPTPTARSLPGVAVAEDTK